MNNAHHRAESAPFADQSTFTLLFPMLQFLLYRLTLTTPRDLMCSRRITRLELSAYRFLL